MTPKKANTKSHSLWIGLAVLVGLWLISTWSTSLFFLRPPNESAKPIQASHSYNIPLQSASRSKFIRSSQNQANQETIVSMEDNPHYLRNFLQGKQAAGETNLEKILEEFQKTSRQVQLKLQRSHNRPSLPLTAYLEPPLPPYDLNQIPRLPPPGRLPKHPLKEILYDKLLSSCAQLPNDFPVLLPPTEDDQNLIECPVHQDPFLPWIHDVFVASDLQQIQIVAHNQRRCHTHPEHYLERLQQLEPQVTLFQSVPIQRIISTASDDKHNIQYHLTSLEKADPDAKETRFICRFHTQILIEHQLQNVTMGETLSQFPYNYEHANLQKRNSHPLLTRPLTAQDTKTEVHNEQVWNSILQFTCPIPPHLKNLLRQQQQQQQSSNNQQASSTHHPNLYVDIVPIRTYPRLDKAGYFDRVSRNMTTEDVTFDPELEFGTHRILPPLEASGRWANIPLCLATAHTHPKAVTNKEKDQQQQQVIETPAGYGQHFLVGCVWASASFTTRGSSEPDTSASERLLEWLTYQLYIAEFDHVYIYDNSSPHSNVTLQPVMDLFPSSKVTRIPWKHPVCNNNRPGHKDPGERSSQYAAETSCRLRFGPATKWMAVLDIDEYFIPQPLYQSIRQWLQTKYATGDTKILSFYQTRAIPNQELLDPIASSDDRQFQWKKRSNTTYLETYNCDRVPFPKPGWSWRAKKQIFQPTFVLFHFVHYSLVTSRILEAPTSRDNAGIFNVPPPYEKRVDERAEAFMLHTKTTSPSATQGWERMCRLTKDNNNKKKKDTSSNNCPIGFPFPPSGGVAEGATNADGFEYNCFSHERITQELAPRLMRLLRPLRDKYQAIKS